MRPAVVARAALRWMIDDGEKTPRKICMATLIERNDGQTDDSGRCMSGAASIDRLAPGGSVTAPPDNDCARPSAA